MGIRQEKSPVVERPRGRRRSYLINRAFQWKYTAVVVVGVFITATFMSYVLFGVLHQQARARIVHPETVSAWENTLVIGAAGLAFAVALAAAFGLWAVLITHRICGPLFVIEGYLAELKQGRIPQPRTLRKKDEFKAFHEAFEQTITALKTSRQTELEQLNQALGMARSGAAGSDQEQRQALELLRAHLAKMCQDAACSLGEESAESTTASPTKAESVGEPKEEYAGVLS